MTTPDAFSPKDWDALFDALAEASVNLTPDEVRASLYAHRIEVAPAIHKVRRALDAAKAREALRQAPNRRRSLASRVQELWSQFAARPLQEAKPLLMAALSQLPKEAVPDVCFNRLNDAATTGDIESLIKDLQLLDMLCEDEDGASQGE